MKKRNLILSTTGFLLAQALFANDTAIYELPVKGIDPLESNVNSTLVKFYGKDASEFMKLLPPVKTVPPVAQAVAKHSKNLTLKSRAYQLSFDCSDADINIDDNERVVVTPLPEGASCSVSLYERSDEGDSLDYLNDGGKEAVVDQLTSSSSAQ